MARQTRNGVPTWAKANALGTGQGSEIAETNALLYGCVDVDGLSKDESDLEVLYDIPSGMTEEEYFNWLLFGMK